MAIERLWIPSLLESACSSYRSCVERSYPCEAHRSRFAIHLGSTKMFHDLKRQYYRSGMKSDVAIFVEKCTMCQMAKTEN